MSGATRPLAPWVWLGLPMLQVVGATIVLAIPLRFWGLSLPEPLFAMPVVFAWAVIRPSMLAPACVLLLGLALDLIWGGALGFWAVCLLIPYGAVLAGRANLAGQSLVVLWAWYAAAAALALGTGYLLTMLRAKVSPDGVSVFWQFLVTAALYPAADYLIERFEDADVRFR